MGVLASQVVAESRTRLPVLDCVSAGHLEDSSICCPPDDSLSSVTGDIRLGMVLTIASTLPTLIIKMNEGVWTEPLQAFTEVRFWDLGRDGGIICSNARPGYLS